MLSSFRSSVTELFDIFFKKRVYRYAAAFSYYVTLSFFPLFILVSIMLAPLQIHLESVLNVVSSVVPSGIVDVFMSHLDYINHGDTNLMLWSAIVTLVTSASGAFRVLMNIMEDIHGRSRYTGVGGFFVSLIMAIAVLLFIYLTCILVMTGRWVMNLVEERLNIDWFTDVWLWIRYFLMFPLMFVFIQSIYVMTTPKNNYMFHRTIGAMTATLVSVLVSMGFSWLISQTNRYTIVYGSLASVMILMIWLFVLGNVLIMGNALNVVIERRRVERLEREKTKIEDIAE